jgi:hypothetical protein
MPKVDNEIVKPVKFVSKYKNYEIVEKPSFIRVENGIPYVVYGKRYEFGDGTYETSDPKEIEFLRKHKFFGVDFYELK